MSRLQTNSALPLLWDSFQSKVACARKMRLYSYAMHSNSVLFDTMIALHCVPCADVVIRCGRECVWGVFNHVHIFESDESPLTLRGATTTLCRNWCEGVLRGVVWCSCGFRSVCRWTMPSAVRFALDNAGGKIQIRVEPDLIWG